jgi:branched-chain amino acid transport system substrate-binding protein
VKKVIVFFILAGGFLALCSLPRAQVVHKRMLEDPLRFTGAGGKVVDPSKLSVISIGLFSPADRSDEVANGFYRGALLAIEQANAEGGFRGVPFGLARRWASDPWAAGSKEMIRLVYSDRVWSVIAFREGAGHIAQQIAAKSFVPVIAPVSTALSLTRARVPWIFRLPPDDRVQAQLLVRDGIIKKKLNRIGLISGTDHDSRAAVKEVVRELERRGLPALFHLKLPADSMDIQAVVERIRGFQPGSLVFCLPPARLLVLLKTLGETGMDYPAAMPWRPGLDSLKQHTIYEGSLYIVRPLAQPAISKAVSEYLIFSRKFAKRFGAHPITSAAYAYDAARLIILSIRSSGLNRTAIREALVGLSGYRGVSGPVIWDNSGSNRVYRENHNY